MSRKRKRSPAALNADLYRSYHSSRSDWSAQVALDRDYYLNKQWTKDEQETLEERGQAPLVINRIYPVVQQKLAQLSMHKPVVRAMPKEEGDNKKAELWSMMIEYVLQGSHFSMVDMEVKRNHIVAGIGYYHVYIDAYEDDGRGEVRVASLPPEIVYVDPKSKKPDYSDAGHIIISQLHSLEQAERMFPDKARQLRKAAGDLAGETSDYASSSMYSDEDVITPDLVMESPTSEKDDKKVRIIERYTKRKVPYYIVIAPVTGDYKVVSAERYAAHFKDNEAYQASKIYRTAIDKTISAGENVLLFQATLPISEYPIIPAPNVWVGTPYPLSDVRYLRGIQDEINKRRSLMILNATSASSSKWLVEEGSVEDNVWDKASSVPGARLPYHAGYEKPTPVFPMPLPNAFMALEAEAKHDVEYSSGIFGVSHGDASQAPETYGATLALEEYANRRLAPSVEVLAHAKKILGHLIIEFSQRLYTLPKFVRVIGDEGLVEEVLINEAGTDPMGNPTQLNELSQGKYDVIVQSGKFAPTNRAAHAQFMMSLYERGAVDNITLIENLDLPKKEKILERLDMLRQQAQVIESQGEQIKTLEGLMQTLRRQLQQAGLKSVVDEYRNLEKSELLETKAKQNVTRQMMDLDRASAQLELKNMVAEHELDLEKEKFQQRKKGEKSKK